jgi:hypothetical protein
VFIDTVQDIGQPESRVDIVEFACSQQGVYDSGVFSRLVVSTEEVVFSAQG